MADLGIYNYIQAALARGETKEQITATLLKGGQPQVSIDDAFNGVQHGKPPTVVDIADDKPRGGLFMNILGTLAILVAAAALILAFLVHAGMVRIPKPEELMTSGIASCTQPDDCVRDDINKIKAEADALYSYANGSYATLCADGVVNMDAATGAGSTALNINASLRNAVNDILLKRGAPSQQNAGISCGSAADRYYVNAAMPEGSASPNYCVDSRGVATSSIPNSRTNFCGSVLTQI